MQQPPGGGRHAGGVPAETVTVQALQGVAVCATNACPLCQGVQRAHSGAGWSLTELGPSPDKGAAPRLQLAASMALDLGWVVAAEYL